MRLKNTQIYEKKLFKNNKYSVFLYITIFS